MEREVPSIDEELTLKLFKAVSGIFSEAEGSEIEVSSLCTRLTSARSWTAAGRSDSDTLSTRSRSLSKSSFASEVELLGTPNMPLVCTI